jgi:hypothetical protein
MKSNILTNAVAQTHTHGKMNTNINSYIHFKAQSRQNFTTYFADYLQAKDSFRKDLGEAASTKYKFLGWVGKELLTSNAGKTTLSQYQG